MTRTVRVGPAVELDGAALLLGGVEAGALEGAELPAPDDGAAAVPPAVSVEPEPLLLEVQAAVTRTRASRSRGSTRVFIRSNRGRVRGVCWLNAGAGAIVHATGTAPPVCHCTHGTFQSP